MHMPKNMHICILGEAIPRELQSVPIAILTNDNGEVLFSVLVIPKIVVPF